MYSIGPHHASRRLHVLTDFLPGFLLLPVLEPLPALVVRHGLYICSEGHTDPRSKVVGGELLGDARLSSRTKDASSKVTPPSYLVFMAFIKKE
jgi:hypothetical protein